MKFSARFQWFLGTGLLLLSLSHWFPSGINVLDLLGAFAHFTLVLSILILFVAALYRLWILAGLSLTASILCGLLILPHFSVLNSSKTADLTIGQFNFFHYNKTPKSAFAELAACNPDIFTVQEFNANWASLTDSIFNQTHPYKVEVPSGNCCYGIALYSKFPIISYEVHDLENTPVISAHIRMNGSVLTVISLHTRPPVFPNETKERNVQLDSVSKMVLADTAGYKIVLGDFNVVPWDAEFNAFLKRGDLKAVRDGFQATFPMEIGLPLIPIDHITYAGNLIPTSCETVTIPGSDHRGLVVGFAFKDR